MRLYPAVDLKDGKCVRLLKGQAESATVFNDNPAAQAAEFAGAGCEWLHVVDLDGAFKGISENRNSVRSIIAGVTIPIQLGGGIRDEAAVENWLELGVARIVLGTAAVENPDLVRRVARRFPGRIAVGIDARGGFAATRGWVRDTEIPTAELARRFEDCGVDAIIHTDIDRDGVKTGPNIEAMADLSASVSIPVIASGGIGNIDDLRALRNCGAKLEGVIVGRALYDGSIDLGHALRLLADAEAEH
ncbi:MAG: 1-(5-phosphoribosyl)-5-[(5-phosphoribosylamino)methylideneamino]imidazole-4-carboxamide isomerase [Rhodobacteraceae bacterium]|nr:1-(5-phosphoribosyl)-5-[(5-phosphoribosylamino)methylideneamino]imidazole-4-carboxamide isomerase [Paracoccaceae bacterium]